MNVNLFLIYLSFSLWLFYFLYNDNVTKIFHVNKFGISLLSFIMLFPYFSFYRYFILHFKNTSHLQGVASILFFNFTLLRFVKIPPPPPPLNLISILVLSNKIKNSVFCVKTKKTAKQSGESKFHNFCFLALFSTYTYMYY